MFLIGTHVAEDGSEISSSMQDAKELIGQLVLETQWQLFSYNKQVFAAEGEQVLVYGQFAVWQLKLANMLSWYVWNSSESDI